MIKMKSKNIIGENTVSDDKHFCVSKSLSHCIHAMRRLENHFSVETCLLFLTQFEITIAISLSLPRASWKDGMSLMNFFWFITKVFVSFLHSTDYASCVCSRARSQKRSRYVPTAKNGIRNKDEKQYFVILFSCDFLSVCYINFTGRLQILFQFACLQNMYFNKSDILRINIIFLTIYTLIIYRIEYLFSDMRETSNHYWI